MRAPRPAPRQPAAAKVARGSHWAVLFASAGLEAVWAVALAESEGFTVFLPALVFCIASPLSMAGLGYAMLGIPVSIAYAVWTGLGAALTVSASVLLGTEQPSPLKLLFIAGIVACVIGLKAAGPAPPTPKRQPQLRD
ncbi:DMT family transporter [Leucobacter massiliensis]|uniref:QacE family quaternary ammonium compound efflux SMR transporter n=1 Tax=Leucobacter massiliensis TaxID=1686285 RepID=A0A2S9QMQ5_9MICO|nr:multidrug efflux SMR transporter [Leucobacter massiliensis]PRI10847.1 QacE family quaternary ammonium compound efflux SMR transporter [Leucobacter massiliensis]